MNTLKIIKEHHKKLIDSCHNLSTDIHNTFYKIPGNSIHVKNIENNLLTLVTLLKQSFDLSLELSNYLLNNYSLKLESDISNNLLNKIFVNLNNTPSIRPEFLIKKTIHKSERQQKILFILSTKDFVKLSFIITKMNQEFNINYGSKEELNKFNYHKMTLRNDLLDLSKKGKVLITSSQPGKGKGGHNHNLYKKLS